MKIETFFEGSRSLLIAALFVLALGGLQACGGDVSLGDAPPDNGVGNGGSGPGGGAEGFIESLRLTLGDEDPRVGDAVSAIIELGGSNDDVVTGVPVTVEVPVTGQRESIESDSQGRGSVELEMPEQSGEIEVVARASGLVARQLVRVRPDVPASLELGAFPKEIAPSRETSIRATVRDQQGNPAPNVEVRIESDNNGLVDGGPSRTVMTDDGGSVVVPVVSQTDADITLNAQVLPGGPSQTLTVTVNSETVSPAQVQLSVGDMSPRVGDMLSVSANVFFGDGQPAANVEVAFDLQPGASSASATTNSEGRATAQLQLPDRSGQVEVVASVGGLVERLTVDVRPQAPASLEFDAFPATIGPGQQTSVRAFVTDSSGNPVPNTDVRIQSDGNGRLNGSQTATVRTDSNGAAVVTVASTSDSDISLSAQVLPDGPQQSLTINVDAAAVQIDSVDLVVGDESPRAGETINVFADVLQDDGDPAAGVDVSFSLEPTGQGATARTNSSGRASAQLQMPNSSGEVTVRVNSGGFTDSQSIVVRPQPPASLELAAFPATIAPGDETTVRAIARDANGNPVPDTEIRFESDSNGRIGNGAIQTVTTDAGGSAIVKVESLNEQAVSVSVRALPDGPSEVITIGVEDLTVSNIVLLASSARLPSSAVEADSGIELTAIATDVNNRVVQGVPIDFAASPSGALQVTDSETNGSGRASAILTTGGEARNRTITVSASASGADASVDIEVVGTRLEVSGPSSIRPGTQEAFDIRLVDSSGNGIRDVTIEVTSENGNAIMPASVVTDFDGRATVFVEATAAGEDTLVFRGFGEQTELAVATSRFGIEFLEPGEGDLFPIEGGAITVRVRLEDEGQPADEGESLRFSATRGELSALEATTDPDGEASVTLTPSIEEGAGPTLVSARGPDDVLRKHQFRLISTSPSFISAQAEPATLAPEESSVITAQVTDTAGNPVQGIEVRFSVADMSAGSLSASTAITDVQGLARTTYVASTQGSSTDGVVVRAEFGAQIGPGDEDRFDETNLTVRGEPLFIVLGSDNIVTKNDDDATYSKTFNAIITDSAGNPPPLDTEFRLQVRSFEYQKGRYLFDIIKERWVPIDTVPSSDVFFGTEHPDFPDPEFGPYFGDGPVGCRSEDPLGTGDINRADDYNNNDVIDPPNVVIAPNTARIDGNGVASFDLRWPQDHSHWLLVRLTVSARVDGTESVRNKDFRLPVAVEDVDGDGVTPPNVQSPFGCSDSCVSADSSSCPLPVSCPPGQVPDEDSQDCVAA